MFGERLRRANAIAAKRHRQWFYWDRDLAGICEEPTIQPGHFRKWNRALGHGPRVYGYNKKGWRKRRNEFFFRTDDQ